jgi:uncharacterized protein (TIGR03067 family)
MRFRIAAILLCVAGTIAADEPKKIDDGAEFKGEWKLVSLKQGGEATPAEAIKGVKISFDGKDYINTAGDMVEEGSYKLDATQSPKTIDLDIRTGPDAGKKQLGIYKLEGGKLIFTVAKAGSKDRPKSFETKEGDDNLEFVFDRERV